MRRGGWGRGGGDEVVEVVVEGVVGRMVSLDRDEVNIEEERVFFCFSLFFKESREFSGVIFWDCKGC